MKRLPKGATGGIIMFELTRKNTNHPTYGINPFRTMEDFERNFFGFPFGNFFDNRELAEFKTDVTDEGDHYMLEADLPGFDKNDINLSIDGDNLVISAERHSKYEDKDEKDKVVRMERSYGSYSRSFDIGGIDADGIKAKYEDGVLKLTLPKKQPAAPESRKLEIE